MGKPRNKADLSIVAAIVLLLAITAGGAYVCGYFFLGDTSKGLVMSEDGRCREGIYRQYESEWQARVFVPAAKCESVLRWKQVVVLDSPQ